jgi:ATP-dependent DNA helicase RecG
VAGQILPGSFIRSDTPAYPFEALREALTNALAHRDYAESGGAVDLAIFDDRLEVTSTGPLHFGLTVDDLKTRHQSRLWNPLIANVLYRRGMIESWGMGTLKILELNEIAGLRPVEFLSTSASFTVQFFAEGYTAPTRVSQNLTELQRRLLSALQELGPSSSMVLSQNVTSVDDQRVVLRNLQSLRELGLVRTIGARRGTKWVLVR